MYGNMQGEWGYSLVIDSIDSEYLEDLYSGNNWYWVEVNHSDGSHDRVGGLYIRGKEDLDEALADHFGVHDYYLVENDLTHHGFSGCKKVKETIVETGYVLV